MKAIKENKIYTITEQEKERYLAAGYNITDKEGNVIERPATAAVPYTQYEKLKKELEETKKELENAKKELEGLKSESKEVKPAKATKE